MQARLLACDASTGALIGAIAAPDGTAWQLVGADGETACLVFAESAGSGMHLWLAGLDGQPLGPSLSLTSYVQVFQTPGGHILLLDTLTHRVALYDGGDLHFLGEVALGYELRNLVADSVSDYVYVNDSAGRVHAIETPAIYTLSLHDALPISLVSRRATRWRWWIRLP
jgi:hypothetical protein